MSSDTLNAVFDSIDEDGSGSLDLREWRGARTSYNLVFGFKGRTPAVEVEPGASTLTNEPVERTSLVRVTTEDERMGATAPFIGARGGSNSGRGGVSGATSTATGRSFSGATRGPPSRPIADETSGFTALTTHRLPW